MANMASNYLVVSGEESDLTTFIAERTKQDGSEVWLLYSLTGEDVSNGGGALYRSTSTVMCDFETAWSGVTDDIQEIALAYPSLSFHYEWEELGSQVYERLRVVGGVVLERIELGIAEVKCPRCEDDGLQLKGIVIHGHFYIKADEDYLCGSCGVEGNFREVE